MRVDLNIPVELHEADEDVHGDGDGPAAVEVHGDDVEAAAPTAFDLNIEPVLEEEGQAGFDLNMEPANEEEDTTDEDSSSDESGDEGDDPADEPGGEEQRKNQFLTNDQRNTVYRALLARSNNGKLRKNSNNEVAAFFSVNRWTVQRIWKLAKEQQALGLEVDVSHQKTKRCGRKRVQVDFSQVAQIPLSKRTTLRSLAENLHVSVSTLHRRFKIGLLRRHSSSLKPLLKEGNKRARLEFCMSMLDQSTLSNDPKFIDMQNIVHIDEKWFNMTKKTKKFYLLPEEEDPHRTVQNKNYIGKVMFLAALARPRYDEHGNETFSGKIGVFPFVKEEPAARRSTNRAAGTMVTKSITVNREVMRDYLICKVIPAIQAIWPEEDAGKTIYIQQDNARTHVSPTDEEFCVAVEQSGLDIRLMHQPPNSPDMNILDLGFFSSIQSLTYQRNPRTIEELIKDVDEEFNEYEVSKVNRVFITLQSCMIETMKCGGGNGYKIPHMNKDRLERVGVLPSRLSCDYSLCESVREILEFV